MKYKVIIVDDEEPARDLLHSYSQKIEELEIVDVLSNALDAKRVINNNEVDILLTDIQMDDLTGLDLVKTLKNPPVTIFTTAYSEYALEGYALDVIDYLVKPISFQRFCKAIDKAIELIQFTRLQKKEIKEEATNNPIQKPSSGYFFVKTNRKLVKVNHDDILFVQSFGEYVKIYTKDDVILALQTTNFMEELLPADDFVRIHRSHIVNINQIIEIDGNQVVIEQHKLPISKRMKDPFMTAIKDKGVI
ncbi:MAG: response regulator transcription factor [Bacteroidetes bacterium]|nr:response regulator transcription factor [Bacteroidota bacterium]